MRTHLRILSGPPPSTTGGVGDSLVFFPTFVDSLLLRVGSELSSIINYSALLCFYGFFFCVFVWGSEELVWL